MPLIVNVDKAVISFLIAALVPGTIAILILGASEISSDPVFGIIGFCIWYLFSAPVVLCIGFITLFISLKIKYGLIIVPPLVGTASGMLIARTIYTQGMNMEGLMQFTISGLATALVASTIYVGTTRVAKRYSGHT
jgi:hypothetical protein